MSSSRLEWDRRSSNNGTQLPSISHFQTASMNGHSPPLLNNPAHDSRDSGNWSMNSARQSNISEHSYPSPLQLPPIEVGTRPSPPDGYAPSPVASSFAASQTSLHIGPHNPYNSTDHDGLTSPSPAASRRSSFDNRLGNLNISSPNGTPAGSQVSLSSTLIRENGLTGHLNRERGIQSNSPHPPPLQGGHDEHPISGNPFGSTSHGGPTRSNTVPSRTAPPIGAVSRPQYGQAPHPNDKFPTKGFPWAFPEPEIDELQGRTSHDARTSATSLHSANSVYGAGSTYGAPSLPTVMMNGQMGGGLQVQQQMGQSHHHHHHHHGLQDRRPSLAGSESTPYSRTPELRVSHKLAERKRRKEMKELFDELRDVLPAERGGKSSKWEVLTKAIEHVRDQSKAAAALNERIASQHEQINQQNQHMNRMQEQHHEELKRKEEEIQRLREDLHRRDQQNKPANPGYHNEWAHTTSNATYATTSTLSNDGSYHSQQGSGPSTMQGIETCSS